MKYLDHVQRGLDYIEANLLTDVAPAAVARHAGVSHWHFQRMFRALTSETLMGYIRARRFAHALDRLATSNDRIIEIALDAGFETQPSFTRAFKKAFQVTPADYRRRHHQLRFLRKARIDADYIAHLHAGVSLEPDLYQQPALHLVGLRTRFFGVDSDKNNLAAKVPALWAAFVPRIPDVPARVAGTAYGLIRQTAAHTDELEYVAAVAVPADEPTPAGLVRVTIPPARYARFTHRGRIARLDTTVDYIYASWLARSPWQHTYGPDLESYGPAYRPDSDDSLIHYAIPVDGDA